MLHLEGSTVGGNITVGNIIFQFNPKTNTESKTSEEPEKFLIGGGFVIAKAVLSQDGTLIINASATSERIFHGVHTDIQVSLFNQEGECIYMSEKYRIPTAGAKWDITCPPNSSLQKDIKISKDMFNNTHRIKIDVSSWEHPGIRRYSNPVKVLEEFRTWINKAN